MNARKTMWWLAATAVAVPLAKRAWDRRKGAGEGALTPALMDEAPLPEVIDQTLRRHEGEDTPIVHAFEDAMEKETQYEEQLAEENGLRHSV